MSLCNEPPSLALPRTRGRGCADEGTVNLCSDAFSLPRNAGEGWGGGNADVVML